MTTHRNELPMLDPRALASEFEDIAGVLKHGPRQATIDDWMKASAARQKAFQDTFWGSIRWPKSLGRPAGASLVGGFSLKLRNHFVIYEAGAGGEIISKDGWMDMPPPYVWEVDDDAEHYHLYYSGRYARYNLYVDKNELEVQIVDPWTNPTGFARYLQPKPLGYYFGSFDGSAIVLDEITVEQHLLGPRPRWSYAK
jgi:hypothetical protein